MNYDKIYFRTLLEKIVTPLKNFYSEDGTGLHVGSSGAAYEDTTIPMEGFSRVLWGLAPLWSGGGDIEGFGDIYIKGLTNGCDSKAPGYWGDIRNYDQKFVEFAAIALALIIAPDKVWEPLSDDAKKNLSSYLIKINDFEVSDNNWRFFPLLVNLALKSLGLAYDSDLIDFCLSRIDSFYLDNGWYRDGQKSDQRDYYIPFAIHFYSLIYSKVCYDEDRERCELFKARAAEFAKTYIYWFDNKGRALVYGRSLTYRFAQAAFWSACVFADVPVFNHGIIKGILVRHFEEWLSNPIFDNSGVLTIGYRYANLHMSESYNSPCSPYWSLKAFLLLAVDDNHPFWSAEPEPLPTLDSQKFLPEAQMIIQHFGNHVTALVPGRLQFNAHVHVTEKYCKFAYSSEFGFSVPRSNKFLQHAAPDSTLSFEIDGYIFTRNLCDEISLNENEIVSKWSPFKGIDVVTTLIPTENGHIRRHKITSEYDCIARDSGFAVSATSKDHCTTAGGSEYAEVKNDFSYCTVRSNTGGKPEVISLHPNTSLVYTNTLMPLALYEIKKGVTEIETVITYN